MLIKTNTLTITPNQVQIRRVSRRQYCALYKFIYLLIYLLTYKSTRETKACFCGCLQ